MAGYNLSLPGGGGGITLPGASAGGGGWASKLTGGGGVSKFNPLGMAAGALGGLFGAMGANKKAKIEAENQNKQRGWEHKLNAANYGETDQWRNRKRNRTSGVRESLMKGILRHGGNGLSKILGGFGGAGSKIAYDEAAVPQARNIYDVAGAPPELKAATGGWQSLLGGAIGGLG